MKRIQGEQGLSWHRAGEAASDRALVLFHGLASNGTRWKEFARGVSQRQELADWKFIAPDLRGHGGSPRRGRIDSETWIADFHTMMHQERVTTCIVGGHCMGANLALRIAAAAPESLAGLVLIEPMVPEARAGLAARLAPLRFLLPPLAMLARMLNRLGIGRKRFPELDLEKSDIEARRDQMAADGQFNADYATPGRDLRYLPTASYLSALYETLRPLPEPETITCPTLALLSSGGLFGDPARTRAWLERIDRIEIAELDAEHWIPTEQPDEMREQILRFATGIDADSSARD
ncbi:MULTISPECIES: alpha/beta fold hydrolase [unclassified Wenzhouxiangella]|uniref:alpha/beta fold hydrolase n=1 Tax=unclassified Wenzhouxiangella TaxID=2613841 RepID=UPI000E32B24F|nr:MULTISPECIES: alpha/beta hydrolase [unclassified Wenzhouxiangella]RFF26971.1 alpha/beta hydrolase [Wenzhouxiangella sp. 15181]RFP69483.1 alpha/beta hydrolase [Wenzhouxiangella sp. 15190]